MINIIGLGYIGLPTALIMSANGNTIVGTDYDKNLVEKLKSGIITFEEEGLLELFNRAIENEIVFDTKYASADMYVVSVPTPYEKKSKKLDPCYVINGVKEILKVCPDYAIIVIESTISPGTIDKYIRPLLVGKKVSIAHAPERIIPGNMISELVNNSRVIGVDNAEVGQKIKEVYASFCKGEIVITDIRTAEMSKVVENTYRDINIAFANELAKICRQDDMNVYEIIRIANMHPRVNILQPGPGVGGHCISVDPWFLVGDYPGLANIILAARKINDSMPEFVLERIADIMKENNISDISRVGLYGLTYKEDVDDVRESPTLQMLEIMRKHLATGIKVYDPMVSNTIAENQYFNFDNFIEDVDIIVIMVGHKHIKERLETILNKVILDTRNICEKCGTYKL